MHMHAHAEAGSVGAGAEPHPRPARPPTCTAATGNVHSSASPRSRLLGWRIASGRCLRLQGRGAKGAQCRQGSTSTLMDRDERHK